MKISIFSFLFALSLAGCSLHATSPADPGLFPDPGQHGPGPESPKDEVTASFATSCTSVSPSGPSYRINVNLKGENQIFTQTTYLNNGSCIGYPKDQSVSVSEVKNVSGKIDPDGIHFTFKGTGTDLYHATKVDAVNFSDEQGLYVHYAGTVSNGATTKSASSFAQIVRHSPYSDHFPYIWTIENEIETNPQSNPWVWSGSRTSDNFSAMMQTCHSVEDVVVPAGHFKACLITSAGQKIWYANVPLYGVVKYEKDEGVIGGFYYFKDIASRLGLPETSHVVLELSSVGY